jgi:preprotein translocase subunit YajC
LAAGFLNYPTDFSIMHMNCFAEVLALAAPPANGQPGAQPNPLMSFLPMILLVVVFYFILIRPQQQRAKQQKKMLEALKSGDKVITAAGIIGVVVTVKDKSVSLRSADAKFEVTKASVTEILDASTPTE